MKGKCPCIKAMLMSCNGLNENYFYDVAQMDFALFFQYVSLAGKLGGYEGQETCTAYF